MHHNSFFKHLLLGLTVVFLVSCDKDFNEIGADVIGDDHFDFVKYTGATVIANNINIGAVESRNLDINPLGIYTNPAFGKTTANFVTQLELATANPTFTTIDNPPTVESVVLTIPYFSKLKSTATDGTKTYELDSLYGASTGRIKLSVFESGFYMRDIDHDATGTQQMQRYYTNQNADFNAVKGQLLNNDVDPVQNNQFLFSAAEYVETTTATNGTVTTTRTAPSMRLKLKADFFQTKILEAASGNLQNNNVFKNYFRGLYFQTENSGSDAGTLAMLNFKGGKITIKYKEDKSTIVNDVTTVTRVEKSLVLNLAGNTVSLLENENLPAYAAAINQLPSAAGHEKLYLKGGEGAVTTIDLFGADNFGADGVSGAPNGIADELDRIKTNGWMINEANLTFYVARNPMGTAYEPNRIYLFDINNKRQIIDYLYDSSTSSNTKFNKLVHGGILEKEAVEGGKGIKYKIRMTHYVRSLVENDSTNVKLGLSVTESIGVITSRKLKTPNAFLNDFVPTASVMNPLGTILYGANIQPGNSDPEAYDKRLKLEIYYTKPN